MGFLLGTYQVTKETEFRNTEQEVEKLLEECGELKRTLKAISSQLSRIEARVKNAFPVAAKRVSERKGSDSFLTDSSMSSEQALTEFDQIVALASSGATSEAERYLERFPSFDLLLIAKEIGATFSTNKPSVRSTREAILSKVRESLLLSRHNRRE
jgi:hypothetical protein